MAGNCKRSRTEAAMKMNYFYANLYHAKFPFIDTDEFISVGLVAIAKVLKCWKKKKVEERTNFLGYVKIALQGEYRRELNKTRIQRAIISKAQGYTKIEEEQKNAMEAEESV